MYAHATLSSLVLAALAAAPAARAQSFNLDVGPAGGALPAATYGGAAASPGAWQALDLEAAGAIPLAGLDGGATAVTLTASTALAAASAAVEAGPTGDDLALVEDHVDVGTTPLVLTIAGLAAGRYQVWTYAFAPDDPGAITYVAVNDDTQAVAGAWPGGFDVFVTHALHELELVEAGAIAVSIVGVDRGVLCGLQLVRLPDDPPPVGDPQGFNLDAGTQLGQPSRGWGGAAEQVGVWMPIGFNGDNPITLNGLDGAPTTVTVGANLPFGPAWFEHDGPSDDEERLLEDYLDLHSTGGTFTFKGVPAGDYVVYTYAWGPDDPAYRTLVTIGDDTQEIGGAWPGALTEGITHARHAVTVPASGKLTIYTFGTKGTLNGIQIVPAADAPVEPSPEVAPEVVDEAAAVETTPEPSVETAPEPVVEAAPEPVVEAAPEPAVEPTPEPAVETAAELDVVARGGSDDGCHGGAPALPALAWLAALALVRVRSTRSARRS